MGELIAFRRNDKTKITPNFARYEFQCRCGCTNQQMDSALAEGLQAIRDKLGRALRITSAYRCPAHNRRVGGTPGSKHLLGTAADWRTADRSVNPVALGILAAAQGFGGVGIYWRANGEAFVHTDTRADRVWWLCTGSAYRYSSSRPFILPTIRRGCTGALEQDATRMLQRLLGQTVDGRFGPGTESALKHAQAAAGLAADGICGRQSWLTLSGAGKYLG